MIDPSQIKHRYPPLEDEVDWKKPKLSSVGWSAIGSSLAHMKRYMDMPDALKASLKMNQKDGFDCPGCAWPDPDDDRSSLGEYCENGIKALAEEATKALANPTFFRNNSIQDLSTWTEYELGKSGRITHPMYLDQGETHYKPIAWKDVFALISKHLDNLDSPDQAIFYTSGRTSNEAAFLYGTLARAYGTNNLPDCSNMCHECSGYALTKTLGIGKGAVTLEDIHKADVIMVIGQNPGTNHPRMLTALEKCKANGGHIIAVNPLKEAGLINYTNPQRVSRLLAGGVDLTDIYLQVKVGEDIACLKAIMLALLELEIKDGGVVDHTFIKNHTSGYQDFLSDLRNQDIAACANKASISLSQIRATAELLASTQKIIICWAMGITQHAHGVQNVQEIVNLLLMKGAVGIPGAGPCPVRGHSNVQGDRTMGIWEKMSPAFLNKLGRAFEFEPPSNHGLATVPAIKAMYEGRAKVFLGMGGNFVSATPDTDYTAEALRRCSLTVQVSTKPNRSHLVHGKEALILPTLGRSEIDIQSSGYQFVSVENSMGIVHNSKGVLPPKSSHLKSEVAIICELADQIFKIRPDIQIDWLAMRDDYNLIREKIEAVIPGFENYNVRVRKGEGFYLPNGVKERRFNTDNRKANFTVNALPDLESPNRTFRLTTLRAHDQYNTTLYGYGDRYRGIKKGREVLFVNAQDLKSEGLEPGEKVDVTSVYNDVERKIEGFVLIPYDIPRGCVGAYFPEANPLVPIDHVNPETHTPVSKNIIVNISKSR